MTIDDASGQEEARRIRVAVRVRPKLQNELDDASTALRADKENGRISLSTVDGSGRSCRSFQFDAVLDEEASQEEVFQRTGMGDLVGAVVQGYHGTVLAYGQTGSGKTHTVEGIRYRQSGSNKGGAGMRGVEPDFQGTDSSNHGLLPRAARLLFQSCAAESARRRFTIQCSFLQIYKEAAYDLLNPARAAAKGLPSRRQSGSGGGPGAAPEADTGLRMRWSKHREFFLENLFRCQCSSAEELLAIWQSGLSNKVMASHRLNLQSSRSHTLFIIGVESHPLAAPEERVSSQLTMVDLAGSERAALTGCSTGELKAESTAINKSLFTLRKVITALTDSCAIQGQRRAPSSLHIPYRDSKLTCLLKNALGGNSITVMIACVAPCDRYHDENLSSLEYASRTHTITNKVAPNEDTKTAAMRQLRQEVAFLREQLRLATQQPHVSAAVLLEPGTILAPGPGVQDTTSSPETPGLPSAGTGTQPQQLEQLATSGRNEGAQKIEMAGLQLVDALQLLTQIAASNQQLRAAYARACGSSEQLQVANDSLMTENNDMRERLRILDQVVAGGGPSNADGPAGRSPRNATADLHRASSAAVGPSTPAPQGQGGKPEAFTAHHAALIELLELRRENQLMRSQLQRWESSQYASTRPARDAGWKPGCSGPHTVGSSYKAAASQRRKLQAAARSGNRGATTGLEPQRWPGGGRKAGRVSGKLHQETLEEAGPPGGSAPLQGLSVQQLRALVSTRPSTAPQDAVAAAEQAPASRPAAVDAPRPPSPAAAGAALGHRTRFSWPQSHSTSAAPGPPVPSGDDTGGASSPEPHNAGLDKQPVLGGMEQDGAAGVGGDAWMRLKQLMVSRNALLTKRLASPAFPVASPGSG